MIALPSFNIGTNVKINLDGEKDKPDVKPKVKTKPNVEPNKKRKQDAEPTVEFDKINNEEEKVALVLGITSILTVWWMFK